MTAKTLLLAATLFAAASAPLTSALTPTRVESRLIVLG